MMSREEKKANLALNLFLLCPCCVYTADMTDARNTKRNISLPQQVEVKNIPHFFTMTYVVLQFG